MSKRPHSLLPLLAAALFAAALVAASSASAYGWPVAPFHQQHPIRGFFGDPRTIYWDPFDPLHFPVNGAVSFHNGVDIVAPAGTRVYPVLSGIVRQAAHQRVLVKVPDGRSFQYIHIFPSVRVGQLVRVGKTVLGTVTPQAGHVHLSEIAAIGGAVDPLLPGHLAPYYDGTIPHVAAIQLRTSAGVQVDPYNVKGDAFAVADAYDEPPLAVPAPWNGLPVTPAIVRWWLKTSEGQVVEHGTSADFTLGLPPNRLFWRVYARGTYQNHPRFSDRQYSTLAGKYFYRLTTLDTSLLPDGVYSLRVTARDTRGNVGELSQPIGICSVDTAPCERLVAKYGPWKPPAPQPAPA